MSAHITTIIRACFAALRQIRSVWHLLAQDALLMPMLICLLVMTKLDLCCSVLAGVSGFLMQWFQSMLNAAARLVFSARRSEHTTLLLHELHWLKVPQRSQYQLCFWRSGACMVWHRHTSQRHATCPLKWTLVADSDTRVRQHLSYHPPADPLLVTEHSLWLLHVPGIPCHPVFGLRRRWLLSAYKDSPVRCVNSSLTLNAIIELSFCTVRCPCNSSCDSIT